MVTQEGLIQLLVQMEKELEDHLLKLALLHMNITSGMRKESTYEYAKGILLCTWLWSEEAANSL